MYRLTEHASTCFRHCRVHEVFLVQVCLQNIVFQITHPPSKIQWSTPYFIFAVLSDWRKKLEPLCHPIRSKNQNQSWRARRHFPALCVNYITIITCICCVISRRGGGYSLIWAMQVCAAPKAVFPPERAIAGIPRYNQRWPPEKREKGQFGPFLLQEFRLNTGIVF